MLDTTDPGQVSAALADLDRTVVVVSSKSGGTVETDSHRRAFISAFAAAGLDEEEIGARFVVVTDPGSPLAETAARDGRAGGVPGRPDVGGRYSALSAFGLVPAALAGVDVGELLDEAEELAGSLADARTTRPWSWGPRSAPPPGRPRQAGPRRRPAPASPASATGPSS